MIATCENVGDILITDIVSYLTHLLWKQNI